MSGRPWRTLAAGTALALAAAVGLAPTAAAGTNSYVVTNLVSDQPGVALHTDPNLVNAWGLATAASRPWWVADNGTDVSTLYDGGGTPFPAAGPLVVKVKGAPTGVVANTGPGFVVSHEGQAGPAFFVFSTESGTIRAWNPTVGTSTPPSTRSFRVAGRAGAGAIYKGLALASTPSGDVLYATDFHNGRVDAFDSSFDRIRMPGAFRDPDIPERYAPFGIQNVGGTIFVTYARQDAAREDDVPGAGHGFVDMFDTSGTLLGRVATRGALNSPWGLAMAPAGFGKFGGDLLVGNFGNGKIHAFALGAGGAQPAGTLRSGGDPIVIDGLWALQFGNGTVAGPTDTLFFTAGPDDESHGLFGSIEAAA